MLPYQRSDTSSGVHKGVDVELDPRKFPDVDEPSSPPSKPTRGVDVDLDLSNDNWHIPDTAEAALAAQSKDKAKTVWDNISIGLKQELSSAIVAARNVASIARKAAENYSKRTGAPLTDAMREIESGLSWAAAKVAPSESELSGDVGVAGKVARGLGAAAVQIPEYTLATVLARNPTLAFALVDAAKQADKGAKEAIKAGAIGAATGKIFGAVGRIPSTPVRIAAGAAAGGAIPAVTGGGVSDVVAGGLLGGAFSVKGGPRTEEQVATKVKTEAPPAPRGAIPEPYEYEPLELRRPETPAKTTKEGFVVKEPLPDITPIGRFAGSPSQIFNSVPEAAQVVREAIAAERRASHLAATWELRARKAVKGLSKSEAAELTSYLDDPKYTLDNPPSGNDKIRQAFLEIRPLTEEIRQEIIRSRRAAGIETPDDWGLTEGWWPHRFEGQWVATYNGEPIPNGWLANTRREAIQRLNEFMRLNPGSDPGSAKVDYMSPEAITNLTPGKRFFGHAQQRSANLPGYVVDMSALYKYIGGAARYVTLGPLRPRMQAVASFLEETRPNAEVTKRWKSYMDQVEGRPDSLIDSINSMWIRKTGGAPRIVERTLGFVRAVEIAAKLGFSPVTAFANMLQVPINTASVIGYRNTLKGYKGFVENFSNHKYDWLLDGLHVRDAVSKAEEMSVAEKMNLYWPNSVKEAPGYALQQASSLALAMFQKAEYANRAVTVIGAYEAARARGMNDRQAVRFAQEADIRSQFAYQPADAAMIFANPFTRTLFQFRSFWQKQLEFMTGLFREDTPGRLDPKWKEQARFLTSVLAASGIVGIPGINAVDAAVKAVTNGKYSILDDLKEKGMVPKWASYGIPGFVGIDASKNVGYGDWFTVSGNPFGPAIQEASLAIQWLIANEGAPKQKLERDILRRISPEARRIVESYLTQAAKRGEVLDTSGRIVVKDVTSAERFWSALGFTPIRMAEEREKYIRTYEQLEKSRDKRQGYVEQIQKALRDGDTALASRLSQEAEREGYGDAAASAVRSLPWASIPRTQAIERRNVRELQRIQALRERADKGVEVGSGDQLPGPENVPLQIP